MTKMITIKGDSIPLPKSIAKKWRGRRVQMQVSDTMVLIQTDDANKAWQRILRAPKGLMRPSEIQREIEAARREARSSS